MLTQTKILTMTFLTFSCLTLGLHAAPQDAPQLVPTMVLTAVKDGTASLQFHRTLSATDASKNTATIRFRPTSGSTTISFVDLDSKATLATSRAYKANELTTEEVFELAWQHTNGRKPARIAVTVTVTGGQVDLFEGPQPQPVAKAPVKEDFDDLEALRAAAADVATDAKTVNKQVGESDHSGVCTDPTHNHGPGGAVHSPAPKAVPAKPKTPELPTSRSTKKLEK